MSFPRASWLELCRSFGFRRPQHPVTWYSIAGSSFIIRVSDVIAEERRSVDTIWSLRLEALGTLDGSGLKLWMEVSFATLMLFQRARLASVETSVVSFPEEG
jgi:hypothetical protein